MQYKFKTIYENKLVSCHINTFKNTVIIIRSSDEDNDWMVAEVIGLIEKEDHPLPVLPVFQYTGKKDMHGEEIYCGHILGYMRNEFRYIIRWHEDGYLYAEEIGKQSYGNRPFNIILEALDRIEIVGHEMIKN